MPYPPVFFNHSPLSVSDDIVSAQKIPMVFFVDFVGVILAAAGTYYAVLESFDSLEAAEWSSIATGVVGLFCLVKHLLKTAEEYGSLNAQEPHFANHLNATASAQPFEGPQEAAVNRIFGFQSGNEFTRAIEMRNVVGDSSGNSPR